ncbi:hypothetical protein SEVIR_7G021500v4 [Setaria viridis]|uniref:Uncharacterized protein n=2 Tax=Setaria TaxID=4554 RepID=K3YB59_SETIT|nr:hypothetical protein SETIT_7G034500v2 [Setaria italica]TKW03410.1 hypothetical protein SEVIR_7G021500v2 [Setaria viridis]
MKSTTVALLILMNMMFTIPYFGHASSQGIKDEETTLLSKSYASSDGTSFAGDMTLGRKLMAETSINSAAVSTDSSRTVSVTWYNDFIRNARRP